MDNCQPEQSIEPHVSKECIEEEPEGKEENESENDGLSIWTPMESPSKGSGKKRKNVFLTRNQIKKEASAWEKIWSPCKNFRKFNRCDQGWFFTTLCGIFKRGCQATRKKRLNVMAIMQRFIMGPLQHMQ